MLFAEVFHLPCRFDERTFARLRIWRKRESFVRYEVVNHRRRARSDFTPDLLFAALHAFFQMARCIGHRLQLFVRIATGLTPELVSGHVFIQACARSYGSANRAGGEMVATGVRLWSQRNSVLRPEYDWDRNATWINCLHDEHSYAETASGKSNDHREVGQLLAETTGSA